MPHDHSIVDNDTIFTIDPDTRVISTESTDLKIMQFDHNSERYTFRLPKNVEGHDMSITDRVEVHYNNIARDKKTKNSDYFKTSDIKVEGEYVVFTWLISGNATQLEGSLEFSVLFVCTDQEGNITYQFGSDVFKGIRIPRQIRNTASTITKYTDEFEQLRKDILEDVGGGTVKSVCGVGPDETGDVDIDDHLKAAIREVVGDISGGVPYEGPYEVTPNVDGQVLPTANKTMTSDITINKIPYAEVSNPGGGLTVTIS